MPKLIFCSRSFVWELSLMTSNVFWPFLTYLPTYLVLFYNIPFWGQSWTPLPTLILDVFQWYFNQQIDKNLIHIILVPIKVQLHNYLYFNSILIMFDFQPTFVNISFPMLFLTRLKLEHVMIIKQTILLILLQTIHNIQYKFTSQSFYWETYLLT